MFGFFGWQMAKTSRFQSAWRLEFRVAPSIMHENCFSLQNFTSTGRALFHESFDDRKIIFRKTDFKLKMG
jgi:hypothetical protein